MVNPRVIQISTSSEDEEGPSHLLRRRFRSNHNIQDKKRKKVMLQEEDDDEMEWNKENTKLDEDEDEQEEDPEEDEVEEYPEEEEIPAVAMPEGEVVRVSGKGSQMRKHYESFEFDKRRYDLEDPVLLVPEYENKNPYVAIIKDISQTLEGKIIVTGQWFYRPEEVEKRGGGSWPLHDTRELFYTFHLDEVPAESVMHKCVVHFVPSNKQLPDRQQHPGFIVHRVYDTEERRLYKLTDKDYENNKQQEIDLLVRKTLSRLGDLPDIETDAAAAVVGQEKQAIRRIFKQQTLDQYQYVKKSVTINEARALQRASHVEDLSLSESLVVEESTSTDSSGDEEARVAIPDASRCAVPAGVVLSGAVSSDSTSSRRRGGARVISPSESVIGMKKIYFVGEALLGGKSLSGFFRPQMKNHLDGFYPRWCDVPIDTKNVIWKSFKKEWTLEGHDPSYVYSKFLQQCGVQYRKFIYELKCKQMMFHDCKDVMELMNKPKPAFMKTDEVWQQYVQHWNDPEHRARSTINARNRNLRKGCSHGFGRKSAATRLHKMAEQGNKPSMLSVMMDVNQKRDKKNNPTGEVYHRELQAAINEYSERYASSHGSDKNPLKEEIDMGMWRTTFEVARRTLQGRVLGMGSSTNTSTWKNPKASSSSGRTYNVLSRMEEQIKSKQEEIKKEQEEMRKRHQEEMNKIMLSHQGLESQFVQLQQTMLQLVPNFPVSAITPSSQFFPPSAEGFSIVSHSAGTACPEIFVQTQRVPRTQHDPSEDEDKDDN